MALDPKKIFTVRNIAIAVFVIGGFILLSRFLNGCKKVPPPPNKELIKYLEDQRKHYDTIETILQGKVDSLRQEATGREQRDSLTHLLDQNRLINSIKSIKSQYGKIPSYNGISNDSLRRILREHFGN